MTNNSTLSASFSSNKHLNCSENINLNVSKLILALSKDVKIYSYLRHYVPLKHNQYV
jgi:hypothetical protein